MLHLATGPNAGQGAASQTYLGATRRISNRLGVLTFLYFPDSNHPKKIRVELVVVRGNNTRISCFTKITSNKHQTEALVQLKWLVE